MLLFIAVMLSTLRQPTSPEQKAPSPPAPPLHVQEKATPPEEPLPAHHDDAADNDPIPDELARRWFASPQDFQIQGHLMTSPDTFANEDALMANARDITGDDTAAPAATVLTRLASVVGGGSLNTPKALRSAVDTARRRAAAMRKYRNHFPFPATTPTGVMALLDDEDVAVLVGTLNILGKDTGPHHFSTKLRTPGVTLSGTTSPDTARCFAYELSFARGSWTSAITGRACQRGSGWHIASSSATEGQ